VQLMVTCHRSDPHFGMILLDYCRHEHIIQVHDYIVTLFSYYWCGVPVEMSERCGDISPFQNHHLK